MIKVSVIIPTYQRANYVGRAIKSVLAQTYRDYEVIVVDDGSTDQTSNVLSQFGNRISLIKQDHRGVSTARNVGILASKGEYISFLDDDDIWMPEFLQSLTPLLDSNPKLGLVYANYLRFDRDGNLLGESFDSYPPKSGMIYTTVFVQSPLCIDAVLVRRSSIDVIGMFDENLNYGEDIDFWLRLTNKYSVDFVSKPLARAMFKTSQTDKDPSSLLRDMICVRERAMINQPKLYGLGLEILNPLFYSLYSQLTRVYLQKGLSREARELLQRYLKVRGDKLRYWEFYIVSWLPTPILNGLFELRKRLRQDI